MLNTQRCLRYITLRQLKVAYVSEQWRQDERERRETEAAYSPVLPKTSADTIAGKGWGATNTGQSRGAKIAIGSTWLAH